MVKKMRRGVIAALAALLIGLASCQGINPSIPNTNVHVVQEEHTQSITIEHEGEEITLKVEEVQRILNIMTMKNNFPEEVKTGIWEGLGVLRNGILDENNSIGLRKRVETLRFLIEHNALEKEKEGHAENIIQQIQEVIRVFSETKKIMQDSLSKVRWNEFEIEEMGIREYLILFNHLTEIINDILDKSKGITQEGTMGETKEELYKLFKEGIDTEKGRYIIEDIIHLLEDIFRQLCTMMGYTYF